MLRCDICLNAITDASRATLCTSSWNLLDGHYEWQIQCGNGKHKNGYLISAQQLYSEGVDTWWWHMREKRWFSQEADQWLSKAVSICKHIAEKIKT